MHKFACFERKKKKKLEKKELKIGIIEEKFNGFLCCVNCCVVFLII